MIAAASTCVHALLQGDQLEVRRALGRPQAWQADLVARRQIVPRALAHSAMHARHAVASRADQDSGRLKIETNRVVNGFEVRSMATLDPRIVLEQRDRAGVAHGDDVQLAAQQAA